MDDRRTAQVRHLLRADDPAALALLYDACAGRLFAYLVFRLGRRADAEEVLQRVFEKAARRRAHLATVKDLESYLFVMTRNVANDYLSELARQPQPLGALEGLLPAPEAEPEPDPETTRALAQALAALPAAQREAIGLRFFANLEYADIARRLGISLNTAASRVRYGLAKLRQRLSERLER
jgi:RNA polymerase sigma-70 factor (ECF subfamily)